MNLNGKRIVDCAGIALINDGRVFLIRPLFNGMVQQYGFPKGHVENGENPEDAAEREFTEETGISIRGRKKELLGNVYAKVDDSSAKRVTIFTVIGDGSETFRNSNSSENGEPENIDGGYVGYEDALKLITTYQQPLVRKLMEREMRSFGDFIHSRIG